jgi:hypothetical protein
MTPTSAPPSEEDQTVETDRPRLQLSATQVIASALAATTATVAASYLGVAGTVIGAAVASVLTVVGNAVYSHSIQRTSERVREVVPAAVRFANHEHAVTHPVPTVRANRPSTRRRPPWTVMAAACVGVFAGVLIVVTGGALVAGRPLPDVLQGKQGSGTSLLGTTKHASRSTPTPQVTVTLTPAVVTKTPAAVTDPPTVTVTPVTKTATPTTTVSPSTPAAPTPTPTPTTSAPTSGSATPSAG